MTFRPRSEWEYGAQIAAEEHADHGRAKARGVRLRDDTEALVGRLAARGIVPGARIDDARVEIFSFLADHRYGTAAIDTPELRKGEDV